MPDIRSVPDAIQWHEGMLLVPQHFQQMAVRCEQLLHTSVSTLFPFHWGIHKLEVDKSLLMDGVLRILELEATMPDGLFVYSRPENQDQLTLDLSPLDEDIKNAPQVIFLGVPSRTQEGALDRGMLERYDSIEGEPVPDENTGASEERIPRLIPRVNLVPGSRLPAKFSGFPLVQVAYENETLSVTAYIPPTLNVQLDSPLGEICAGIAHKLRQKAAFLSKRVNSPSSAMRGAMVLTTKTMVFNLVSALPQFEAVLNTGMAHPYALYLGLCSIVGQVAGLGPDLIPPVLPPYDHNNLLASFMKVQDYIFDILDENILESHTALSFDVEAGTFFLAMEEGWIEQPLAIGVRTASGVGEQETLDWMGDCLIGSDSVMESMKNRRVLGAKRQRVDSLGELIPTKGSIMYAVDASPEFIVPGEVLRILNSSPSKAQHKPSEIVLYVKNPTVS